MPSNHETEIRRLENKIREIETREREIDRKLSEFNRLVRERQRLDEESHQAVIQELGHLDRQMSMLSTRAEDQIAKLDLDRDDFGSLITDVGGINTNVSSVLNNVGNVDTNVGSALTSIGNISQDVDSVLTKQNQISSEVAGVKQTANNALNTANSAQTTANSANSSAQDALAQLALIPGDTFTPASFISSTRIETSQGKMRIRDIEPGIRVLRPKGYGPMTRLAPETVLATPRRAISNEKLIKVVLDNKVSFIATENHAMAVCQDGQLRLIKTKHLQPGVKLYAYQRWGRFGIQTFRTIKSIHDVKGFPAVYNLTLPHRQFLIDGGVLAH